MLAVRHRCADLAGRARVEPRHRRAVTDPNQAWDQLVRLKVGTYDFVEDFLTMNLVSEQKRLRLTVAKNEMVGTPMTLEPG